MRGKTQEREVLHQGITFLPSEMTAAHSLPPPLSQPASLPSGSAEDDPHHFPSPPNTAGTAKTKRRRLLMPDGDKVLATCSTTSSYCVCGPPDIHSVCGCSACSTSTDKQDKPDSTRTCTIHHPKVPEEKGTTGTGRSFPQEVCEKEKCYYLRQV